MSYIKHFLVLWTFWIFTVKSQMHLKNINYYEPITANGIPSPSILKSFKPYSAPLIFFNKNSQREIPWVANSRKIQKNGPEKLVFYYPSMKTNSNPYNEHFQNTRTNNVQINDYYYSKNRNHNNKNIDSKPERERMKIENEEIRSRNQIKNSDSQNGIYTRMPNSFMEPPGLATSDYRLYEKPENLKNYKNHKLTGDEKDLVKDVNDRAPYIRDHAPENQNEKLEESSETENKDKKPEKHIPKTISNASEISPDGDRVEFQIQGHDGPKTYVFGFDTGDGKNRQYRLEERFKDGTVKGQYGYYDARGKLRAIKYIASPMEGYEEKHHESFLPNSSE